MQMRSNLPSEISWHTLVTARLRIAAALYRWVGQVYRKVAVSQSSCRHNELEVEEMQDEDHHLPCGA